MRNTFLGLLAVSLLAAVSGTRAQDAAPPSAASAEAPPQDLAAELYDLAFEMLARGERVKAGELLREIKVHHPLHRLALNATELLALLETAPAEHAPTHVLAASNEVRTAAPRAKTTAAARAELVFFQSVHGLVLGIETCVLLECEDARAWAVTTMVGAGAGLGLSFYLSRDGVTGGLARALTTGTEWGAWNALMLGFASDAFERGADEEKATAGGLILGQLLGLGAGGALYHFLKPTTGQVSLTSSGGIWTTTAGALLLLIASDDYDENAMLWTLWAASDIGLLAGGYLASRAPMTTSRVLLIDAGGLLGLLTGGGLGVLVQGEEVSRQAVGTTALIGLLGGLGVTYYLTSGWGDDDTDDDATDRSAARLSLGVLPAPGGALGTARVVF